MLVQPCRLEAQDDWTRQQAATNGSAFWAALRLLHAQVSPGMPSWSISSQRHASTPELLPLLQL